MPDSFAPVSVPGIDGEYSRKKIMLALMLPLAMSLIAVSMINVALPSIEHGLGASSSDLQWVLSGYALVFGMMLVPAGRLGDIMGRSMFLVAGVVLFNLASLACGTATTPLALNAFRLLQGIGAGMIGPQSAGIIQQYFRGAERAKAFAIFGMTVSVAVAIGPLLCGGIISIVGPDAGWRTAFLANVPIGILAIIAAIFWLPWGRERQFVAILTRHRINTGQLPKTQRKPDVPTVPGTPASLHVDLDPIGMLLLVASVVCIMVPFINATHPIMFLLLILAAVLLVAWVRWERGYKARGHEPMVDMSLFSHSTYINGTSVSGSYFLGGTSIFVLVALYVQDGMGATPLQSGLLTLPNALISGVSAMVVGRYAFRYARTILFGCHVSILTGIAGLAITAWLAEVADLSFWWMILPTMLIGIGQGGLGSCNQTATLMDVPPEMGGTAGGVKQTAERVGTAVGNAIITAIFYFALAHSDWSFAFIWGLAGIACFIIVSASLNLYDRHVNGPGVG
ncbi:MFS transporter [Nanchangia anserum]|uniref:MFS transporter n=1 Tax=Nanchangia anserum TaxID=2692125 RepID=A0A8I0GCG9_9ACTO|nr:MFS transporter [Nanchangia anserum]MBD3689471.1 MFS transporter [Nanchangia anserum]QOX81666.1 MFS transporter [Nanchangia anserum]